MSGWDPWARHGAQCVGTAPAPAPGRRMAKARVSLSGGPGPHSSGGVRHAATGTSGVAPFTAGASASSRT